MTKYPQNLVWSAAKNLGVAFDLDNLKGGSGFYESDTPTNGPGTGVWFVTVIKSGVDGQVVQNAVKKGSPGIAYSRSFSGSAWAAWAKVGKVGTQAAPAAHTTSFTLSVTEMLAGWVTVNQGGGAGCAATLPTGPDMDVAWLAAYPGASVGDTFDFTLINLSTVDAEDATLTAASGFTIVGNAVVEGKSAQFANASGTFRVRRAAGDTFVAYRIS